LMIRGLGVRSKSLAGVAIRQGIKRSTFSHVAGWFGDLRLARRNRVQVLPDLGNETRKTSSGRICKLLPGGINPR
jgi:hypothetical protein